jgi:hypothetical protein
MSSSASLSALGRIASPGPGLCRCVVCISHLAKFFHFKVGASARFCGANALRTTASGRAGESRTGGLDLRDASLLSLRRSSRGHRPRRERWGENASALAKRDWGDEAAYVADPDGNVIVVALPRASH